mgnify:CR=1 FL=1
MLRGIYQNSSAMQLLESKMDNTANNIANVNTSGYRKRGVFFQQLVEAEQAVERNLIDVKLPAGKVATYIDNTDGKFEQTGNPLDVAIKGDGFFTVQTSRGQGFTRAGEFKINSEGMLVTSDGDLVMGEGGPIELTGNNFQVDQAGNIAIDSVNVNKLLIQKFDINDVKTDGNLFYPQGNIEAVSESDYKVSQGFVEHSNVDIVKEMVSMITTQRNYGNNQRLIRSYDESLKKVNMVGK